MISLTYSLTEGELTEEQSEAISQYAVQWVKINTRNGRTMYDSIVDIELIDTLNGFLDHIGREPVIIGGWKKDGLAINKEYKITIDEEGNETKEIVDILDEEGNAIENPYPFQEAEYISLMPDIVEYDEDGNVIGGERPTEAKQLHSFGGWDFKIL